MRVWLDLANSPHVPLLKPIADRLAADGHEVLLTARDHAQTVELAGRAGLPVVVVGGLSPPGRIAKGRSIARRARDLRALAGRERPDVAFSHGSYAQAVAAKTMRIPLVVMMDYEYQPANHLSFRLADRVVVPAVFPEEALRRFGARRKALRYEGFKEELYLAGRSVDTDTPGDARVVVVLRPPPEGALYHRGSNARFDELVEEARSLPAVDAILLPRSHEQRQRYGALEHVVVPPEAVDGASLLARADLVIGAGGTMNREAALLGVPTYTVFGRQLAAVDAELIRLGAMHDLRDPGTRPSFVKRGSVRPFVSSGRAERLQELIVSALEPGRPRPRHLPAHPT